MFLLFRFWGVLKLEVELLLPFSTQCACPVFFFLNKCWIFMTQNTRLLYSDIGIPEWSLARPSFSAMPSVLFIGEQCYSISPASHSLGMWEHPCPSMPSFLTLGQVLSNLRLFLQLSQKCTPLEPLKFRYTVSDIGKSLPAQSACPAFPLVLFDSLLLPGVMKWDLPAMPCLYDLMATVI